MRESVNRSQVGVCEERRTSLGFNPTPVERVGRVIVEYGI